MKAYQLNKEESFTVMEMLQDAIDRGMICSHYKMDTLNEVLSETTDSFGVFNSKVEFEIVLKVKEK